TLRRAFPCGMEWYGYPAHLRRSRLPDTWRTYCMAGGSVFCAGDKREGKIFIWAEEFTVHQVDVTF
ncbi:hypothetical protein ACOQLP_31060, partial [Klebsiella pneumoniae]|uniref:hypothetical protein n=1 Tax=Klebsiella pneumoniae TaxID=573 RepID=UPI003018998B